MPSEQFERKLRSRLEEARVQPRPELWDAIALQVAEQTPRRRAGFWIWLDGLLGLAMLLLFLFPQGDLSQHIQSQQATHPIVSEQHISSHSSSSSSHSTPLSEEFEKKEYISTKSTAQTAHSVLNSIPNTSSPLSTQTSSPASIVQPADPGSQSQQYRVFSVPTSTNRVDFAMRDISSIEQIISAEDLPYSIHGSSPDFVDEHPQAKPAISRWRWNISLMGLTTMNQPLFDGQGSADAMNNFPRSLGGNQQIEDIFAVTFPHTGYAGRVSLAYQLSRKVSIESGVGYSYLGQGEYQVGRLREAPIGPTSPEPLIQYEAPYFFNQAQIEIPLLLNIALTQGAGSWIFSPGISMNFQQTWTVKQSESQNVLNASRLIETPSEVLVLKQRAWYPHLQGRLLYQRNLNSHLGLYTGPIFQYQLMGSYEGAQSVGQPKYRFGVELGVQLK